MQARNLCILLSTLVFAPAAFSANIIDDVYGTGAGSFELPGHAGTNFITLPNGQTVITGWTVGGSSIDWVKSVVWNASSGGYSIDMNGTVAEGNPPAVGAISTVIPTTQGSTYRVTFDMTGYLGFSNPTNPKAMRVGAGDVTADYFFTATNTQSNLPLALNWTTATFDFVATSATSTITFTSLITDNHSGMLLDNVRVVAIPEPAAPLLLGTAGLGLVLRRRRSR